MGVFSSAFVCVVGEPVRQVGAGYLCAALLALTAVAYLPLWQNEFVDFDDELYITQNPQVQQGLNWSTFAWAWTTAHGKYWLPVTWLSFQFDAHFYSTRGPHGERLLSPAAFHGQNLVWHAASVLLLFALWRRLTGARWRSFLVAALFAVHPMHVESVAWATERKDVLSVFFGLVTLWAYLRYLARPGWRSYLGVVAAYLVSLLSKPMLITLPCVLLLLDYWPLRRMFAGTAAPPTAWGPPAAPVSFTRLVVEKLPLFVLAAVVGIITAAVRQQTGAALPLGALPLSARLANAAAAYGWYLATTLWPVGLGVFYPHPFGNWAVLPVLAGAGALLVLTGVSAWQARRRPWLVVGWLWFVGTLAPVIGLVQGGEQAWADRFTYWPHLGLFVALSWEMGEAVRRWRIPAGVSGALAALVLGSLGVLTWIQVGYWHDPVSLWHRALAVTRDNHRAHVALGKWLLERGRFDRAGSHFAEAVRLQPDVRDYQYGLGAALLSLGEADEAARHFHEALRCDPNYADAWHNLGLTRLRQGKGAVAGRCFRKVLELEPEAGDALTGLGLALWREGRRREAGEQFKAALRINPKDADAWNGLGVARLAEGEVEEAVEDFGKALQYKPQLGKAYSNLGVALGRLGEWGRAVSCHAAAVRQADQAEQLVAEMNGHLLEADSIAGAVLFRCRLAFALRQIGADQDAAAVYRTASHRDPDWPTKFTAEAWRLATAADPDARDPQFAYEFASQALAAVADPPAAMLDVLAATHAALGRFPEAVRTAQQALALASSGPDPALAHSLRDHLRRYEQGQAVTTPDP
jgi:tetratricopeptide (TPR) repeat protein